MTGNLGLGDWKTALDPTHVASVNNRTTFVFDALNREIQQTDPLNKTSTFAYDAISRMTSTTDRLGRRRDFSYDDANRLTVETWRASNGTFVQSSTFTYDAVGNMLTYRDPDSYTTLTYDGRNRVATSLDQWVTRLTFSYDAVGNRTKVVDSIGGVTTPVNAGVTTSTYDGWLDWCQGEGGCVAQPIL
ncbi:MAG: hypothetical protein L0Y72_00750 [Gemmataceae bacterium]|nr:hypothetical protein [Gemmataceae bacterium]MCI0737539.1 hypothetical protein [Gemmataceae bacterium]